MLRSVLLGRDSIRRWLTLALFSTLMCGVSAHTEVAAAEDLFAEQLAAGEFAPARDLAANAPEAAVRDELLQQLSAAQADIGARRASAESAGEIGNDQVRGDAFARLGAGTTGAQGGGSQPDFQSLIDLITSTIAPTSWTDVGGTGAIQEFRSGVHIDAAGTAHRLVAKEDTNWLSQLREQSRTDAAAKSEVRAASGLRKISLTRLEREVQKRRASGEPLEEDLLYLAGLQRVQYVLIYPETGDLVLAGPAGNWHADPEGRMVSTDNGRPVVQLNDLICLLQTFRAGPKEALGVSIDPRKENLAAAQEYISARSGSPIKPNMRNAWLKNIRDRVGLQDVHFHGVDPRTHVAEVLFEADYRMKLVGIGLEEPVPGVISYLDSVKVDASHTAPPMDVLRWWFTMNYSALVSGDNAQAFEIKGQGVQVLSENEFLAANGQRQHTGSSQDLNQEFANSFTQHFQALAEKYPIYAELQNVFDLSLVCAVMEQEHLADRVGWHMTCFGDSNVYQVPLGPAPTAVESVMNHRVIKGRQIVAAVSGGVHLDPFGTLSAKHAKSDSTGKLGSERDRVKADKHRQNWWWD